MLNLEQKNHVTVNIWTSAENQLLPGANVGHVSIETNYSYMSLWPAPRAAEVHVSRSQLSKIELVKRDIGKYFESRSPKYMQSYEFDELSEGLSEGHYQVIDNFSEKQPGQKVVLFDAETNDMQILTEAPRTIKETQVMLAVTPCVANVRLALYSLDVGKIMHEFNQLKQNLEGWRLAGSNVLSRTFSHAHQENCSSLAYRLLQAGGFSGLLGNVAKSSFSSQTSSVVKPDDLAKYLVLAKVKEQEKHTETQYFSKLGESSLDDLKVKLGLAQANPKKQTLNLQFK